MEIRHATAGATTTLILVGNFDEESSAPPKDLALKIAAGRVVMDLSAVGAINSLGLRGWMIFLRELNRKSCTYVFERCSASFIDFSGMVGDFLGSGTVTSYYAPFICEYCRKTKTVLFERYDVGVNDVLPPQKCPKCGETMRLELEDSDFLAAVHQAF